jgi:hypothetical protein
MANSLFGAQWRSTNSKSIFTSNFRPSQESRRYDELDNGYTLTVQGEQAGQQYTWTYTAYYDGRAHPVAGRDDVDSIIISKDNDDVTSGWFLKDGVVVAGYQRGGGGSPELVVTAGGRRLDGSTYFDTIHYTR